MAAERPSTEHIKVGLITFASGLGLALVGGVLLIVLLGDGFSAGQLTQSLHLNFGAALLLMVVPFLGALAAATGFFITVFGLVERLLHR